MSQAVNRAPDRMIERIKEIVDEVLASSSAFVVEVEVRGSRGSRVVDIYVDSDEGIGIDELARISREIEFLLDTEEVIEGAYSLNVSSPGVDRPLALPRQYRKNVGRPLRVHFRKADGSGNTETTGKLVAVDEDSIQLENSGDDVRRIQFEDIIWAKVQLPW